MVHHCEVNNWGYKVVDKNQWVGFNRFAGSNSICCTKSGNSSLPFADPGLAFLCSRESQEHIWGTVEEGENCPSLCSKQKVAQQAQRIQPNINNSNKKSLSKFLQVSNE